MNSRLAEIISEKDNEVKSLKDLGLPHSRGDNLPPIRDFEGAISKPNRINLIAEIKFASPSAGIIREKADPVSIGKIYEEAGAAAISLLTDRRFFKGDINHLPLLKKETSLPLLRKDFIVDDVQVSESRLWGADAVLLIASILSKQQLKELLTAVQELGMAALTEVHDRADLEKAVDCNARIIGINNRNLDTFEVDIRKTMDLAPLAPDNQIIVSESGIHNKEDILFLKQAGIQAVLVGTSIMKSHDVKGKVKELVRAGRR